MAHDEYSIPKRDGEYIYAAEKYRDIMHRIMVHTGYTYNEIRSIWRRSAKDREALQTICELLGTRQQEAVAYLLDVNMDTLKKAVG